MSYKTGEMPQLGDAVMGVLEGGAAARGAVIGLRDEGRILLQRRAPYEGQHKPMKMQYDEADSKDFSLVYRHKPAPVEPAEAKPEKKSKKK